MSEAATTALVVATRAAVDRCGRGHVSTPLSPKGWPGPARRWCKLRTKPHGDRRHHLRGCGRAVSLSRGAEERPHRAALLRGRLAAARHAVFGGRGRRSCRLLSALFPRNQGTGGQEEGGAAAGGGGSSAQGGPGWLVRSGERCWYVLLASQLATARVAPARRGVFGQEREEKEGEEEEEEAHQDVSVASDQLHLTMPLRFSLHCVPRAPCLWQSLVRCLLVLSFDSGYSSCVSLRWLWNWAIFFSSSPSCLAGTFRCRSCLRSTGYLSLLGGVAALGGSGLTVDTYLRQSTEPFLPNYKHFLRERGPRLLRSISWSWRRLRSTRNCIPTGRRFQEHFPYVWLVLYSTVVTL